MRQDGPPLTPDGADSCRALALAMLWTLAIVIILTIAVAIAWSPAQ